MTGSNKDEIERKKTAGIITLLIVAFYIFAGHSPIFAENRNSTAAGARAAQAAMRLDENYGKLPLSFELNCGQTDPRVKFLARSRGYDLFLTTTEAVLRIRNAECGMRNGEPTLGSRSWKSQFQNRQPETNTVNWGSETVLRMKLIGVSAASKMEGIDALPGRSNYFMGSDPKNWLTDVPTYSRVRWHEVYPGIDVVYYGNQHQLEYDFVVNPGADAAQIAFDIEGADKIEVSSNGDLLLHTPGGLVVQRKAIVYQEIDGLRREIAGGYVLEDMHRLHFRLAKYDSRRPLVIDPTLDYSTYLGGSGRDQGFGIAVDSAGNAYVTGETTSANFPITPGTVQTFFSGGFSPDAFVAKLNPAGSALVYSTYLGGNGRDQGFGIAVDKEGNAYVAGATFSTNFPTTPGVLKRLLGGTEDAFVAKLNPTGSALVYSTYLGGSSTDFALGIALDAAGNTYVTGGTRSADFPISPGAFQTSLPGGFDDAFVTKVNPTGSAIVYATYLGGAGSDEGFGIAVDASGSAYVTGETTSVNFPTSPGAAQAAYRGNQDGFVIKLDPGGAHLAYGTYLGGTAFDQAKGIAVDADGNAYVTGDTTSANFPTTPGALQPLSGGNDDAFVTKLNASGSAFVYSSYLGGMGFDFGESIAVDSAGNAYVTGGTKSVNFPTTSDAAQATLAGNDDVFISKLNAAGSMLIYSTYLGGTGLDDGFSVAVDSTGATYVTGVTASANFPTSSGARQRVLGGGMDAFVVKIAGSAAPPTIACPANIMMTTAPGECSRAVNFATPAGSPGSEVTCSPASGSLFSKGITTVSCTAKDASGNTATCSFTVTLSDNELPKIVCPASITTTTAPGECSAVVSYPPAVASDNCSGVNVSYSTPSGALFPRGTTIVSATATDASGNTQSCAFTVTVVDTEPPKIVCPADISTTTAPGQCAAVVSYPAAVLSDNCSGVNVSYSEASGALFPKGTTTVTATATDASGNTAACSFSISITDIEPPKISCPASMTVSQDSAFGATVEFPTPAATDNCSDTTVVSTPSSGSVFGLGTTTVTSAATDSSGNEASCSFNVTVVPPPSTAGAKVTAGGFIPLPEGNGSFGLQASVRAGQPSGTLTYQDHTSGQTVKSTRITALVVTGTHARIFGTATIDGTGSFDFVADLDDLGEPGAGADKFQIQLSNGYLVGGTLDGGNVQVH